MRDLTPKEVVARWLWGAEYAASGLSAIEWYAEISESRRKMVADFLREIRSAEVAVSKGGRLHGVKSGQAND